MKTVTCAYRPWRAQQAFTLVEVMVALSILSLVMLATVTGLRTLANTQLAIERTTSRIDEVRTVSGFIRDTLESAILDSRSGRRTRGASASVASGSSFFELSRYSVAWKATVLFGENFGGSYLVRVAREDDQLVLRWQEPSAKGAAGDWAEAQSRILVTDLEEFEVTYKPDFFQPWTDEARRDSSPQLVRMQIKSRGKYWPDLILRVPRTR
jgi:general secretion pathway protein J